MGKDVRRDKERKLSARVFISCGQASAEEIRLAANVASVIRALGFEPYVAITAQTLSDVNASIIGRLKISDYYVFIDLRRDPLAGDYRGSLFTNQELAIAYLLGFQHVIVLQQSGVRREGLMAFMAANATVFHELDEVPALVESSLKSRSWSPTYTRCLAPGPLLWSAKPIRYRDHTGERVGYVLHIDIRNGRPELAAFDTVLRLETINDMPCRDPTPLKASGRGRSYQQVIWPSSRAAFDLLLVGSERSENALFLNSILDVQREAVFRGTGPVSLRYSVVARDFPATSFSVHMKLPVSEPPELPALEV